MDRQPQSSSQHSELSRSQGQFQSRPFEDDFTMESTEHTDLAQSTHAGFSLSSIAIHPGSSSPVQTKTLSPGLKSSVLQRDGEGLPPVPNYQLSPPSLLNSTDPAARYHLGGESQLRLDPQIQIALQLMQQQLHPAFLQSALSQLSFASISLTPPPDNQGIELANRTGTTSLPPAATSATPNLTPTPLVPPGTGPSIPSAASPDDLRNAILAIPGIESAVTSLRLQAEERLLRDWNRLRLGEQIGVVSAFGVVGAGAIAGVIHDPSARRWALAQLNGQVFAVPGLPWLRTEINTQNDGLMLGLHLDLGALLPPILGFGPGSSSAIGGPPEPQPFVPGVPVL